MAERKLGGKVNIADNRVIELLVISKKNRNVPPCWFYDIGNNGKD